MCSSWTQTVNSLPLWADSVLTATVQVGQCQTLTAGSWHSAAAWYPANMTDLKRSVKLVRYCPADIRVLHNGATWRPLAQPSDCACTRNASSRAYNTSRVTWIPTPTQEFLKLVPCSCPKRPSTELQERTIPCKKCPQWGYCFVVHPSRSLTRREVSKDSSDRLLLHNASSLYARQCNLKNGANTWSRGNYKYR